MQEEGQCLDQWLLRTTGKDLISIMKSVALLIATSHSGLNESRICNSFSPPLPMTAVCLILREMRPYLLDVGGMYVPLMVFRESVQSRFGGEAKPPPAYNSLLAASEVHGGLRRGLLREEVIDVIHSVLGTENADDMQEDGESEKMKKPFPLQLRTLLGSMDMFLRAYHCLYFANYVAAWKQGIGACSSTGLGH